MPENNLNIKSGKNNIRLLFETCRPDKQNKYSYLFKDPVKAILAYDYSSAEKALENIEDFIKKKYWVAGYFSYELGYGFEKDSFAAISVKKEKFPLLEFYVFRKPEIRKAAASVSCQKPGNFKVSNIKFNIPFEKYKRSIQKIKHYIENGDVYQINYTGKLKFDFSGNAYSFYRNLTEKQAVQYSAYLKLRNKTVLSLSPELFFSVKNGIIESKPMKGTLGRGRDLAGDKIKIKELSKSSKNRAENIMITDLIRNDLGRICVTGSVSTSRIYEVLKYNTLLQMITTVKGRLKNKISWKEILKNIFPGGSITGAPKIRAMQIIKELEKENRKIYCGALGFISPENNAVFSIPIRTILLEKKTGEMGIGSGIVYDSGIREEYEEALLKAKFLTEKTGDFKLIETILWDKKYILLRGHMNRLIRSAKYFDFKIDAKNILRKLKVQEKYLKNSRQYRVRLLLLRDGSTDISKKEIVVTGNLKEKAVISKTRSNSNDRYLYHKTTHREFYEKERRKIEGKGLIDVIFLNERDEVTEGAITNVFIERKGKYYTPPVSSGLLPGVFREYLIRKLKAVECVLKLKDLKQADRVFLVNSVRGITDIQITKL